MPWAPCFLGDRGSHGTRGAGRQGAPPHLQSPLQLCLYSAGMEKRLGGQGTKVLAPTVGRQGLARQSEGLLCQSTSRAHSLPGAPWEPSQEDNGGQNPQLPTTPQDNLGAPGGWREQGGAEKSKPVLHRSPRGSFWKLLEALLCLHAPGRSRPCSALSHLLFPSNAHHLLPR